MTVKLVEPFGSWKSPITSELISGGVTGLAEIALDGSDIYWIEARAAEAGKNRLVRMSADGSVVDLTAPEFNVRTRVHEYGGGAYLIDDGLLIFSNFDDNRLYRQQGDGAAVPLTSLETMRYADFIVDRRRNRIIAVREDHSSGSRETENTIVAIALDGSDERVLVSGADFYSSPRISPDGSRLAWLTWNHPNMPWDCTELWIASVSDGGVIEEEKLAAGGPSESLLQPKWSPEGELFFISDRTGWWNIYRIRNGVSEPVVQMEAEFGSPHWTFGSSVYAFESKDRIIATYNQHGIWRLGEIDLNKSSFCPIDSPYTDISNVKASRRRVVFRGGTPSEPFAIVELNTETGTGKVLRRSIDIRFDRAYISSPQAIDFPTEGDKRAYAFFYPPTNPAYRAPEGERPPLIVISHGGPTGGTTTSLGLGIQYWTSRGFGVLDVNYGGSTGYGREYRERLNGQWGVVDIDDCVNAAKYIVGIDQADPNRLIIRGASAGGYTTLAALTFRDIFKAGASYFGVSDVEALERDCHKFESRYNHSLVGAYPDSIHLYHERSPIHFTNRLSCPIILFQGLDDKVVPPNQAEMMFEAMKEKGLPVAYVAFEREGHGFRRSENIKRALDAELFFYSKVFGFDLPEPVEPVTIENL